MDTEREEIAKKMADAALRVQAIELRAQTEGRALTPNESREVEAYVTRIDAAEREYVNAAVEEIDRRLAAPRPRVVDVAPDMYAGVQTATRPPITGGLTVAHRYPNHGFTKGSAEYLNSVVAASQGVPDPRLIRASVTTYGNENAGPDGAFAVPPDFRKDILEPIQGDASLLPKFNPIPTQTNGITIPVEETTPWGTSGITAAWTSEAATIAATKPVMKQLDVKLHKAAALVHLSDELLADSPATGQFVMQRMGSRLAAIVNEALVSGTGNGQPLGLLRGPGLVTLDKETTQTTATVVALNVGKMLSRLPPSSLRGAFWLCHTSVLPQLWTMAIGNQPVYAPAFQGSPYGGLLGLPVVVSEFCSTMGTTGDLLLVGGDAMVVAVRSEGPHLDTTIAFAFDQALSSFRATIRVGAAPTLSAPVARKNGTETLSSVVALATRP
jgi:HK97 family phage major capsid protein